MRSDYILKQTADCEDAEFERLLTVSRFIF